MNSNGAINLIQDGFGYLKNYYKGMASEMVAGAKMGNPGLVLRNQETRDAMMAQYNMAVQNNQQIPKGMAYPEGSFSTKRLAGVGLASFAAVNIPYRMISGGSLYRDSNGNSNIIGVPVI